MRRGFDFANVLFAGPCNRFCPFCIGKEIPAEMSPVNLDVYPPLNWDKFVRRVQRLGIREVVFTGTTTDPHLYHHEEKLIARIRRELPAVRLSIHTNGALSLKKLAAFNAYDRACISLPSLNKTTYAKMMGVSQVPNLGEILAQAKIPVKISCVVNEHNAAELDVFLGQLAELGVKRAVIRRLFGDGRDWQILQHREAIGHYRGNPTYDIDGMEVTWWNFDTTTSRSINLFADGTMSAKYLLTQAAPRKLRIAQ